MEVERRGTRAEGDPGPLDVERRDGAAFHVGLLDDDSRSKDAFRALEEFAGEADVLAGIRRAVFDQDGIVRHAEVAGDPGHRRGFGFRPVLCHPAVRAGEKDPRGEAGVKEVRGVGGDAEVVAAEDEDAVGGDEGVVQTVVVPEDQGGGEVVGVHGKGGAPAKLPDVKHAIIRDRFAMRKFRHGLIRYFRSSRRDRLFGVGALRGGIFCRVPSDGTGS